MAKNDKQADDKSADTGTDDVQKVALVPAPVDDAGIAVGAALTPEQQAGIEPLDPVENEKQAAIRDELPNRQTDHERENALDPVSRSPNTGITADAPLTAIAAGSPPTDMSGRPPYGPDDVERVRDSLRKAKTKDRDSGVDDESRQGYRTANELGVSRAVLDAMVADGAPLEAETAPGGQFFPDTGKRYRITK